MYSRSVFFCSTKNLCEAIAHIHCYHLINFWSHINKTDIFQCIKSMENKTSWRLSSSSFDRWCFGEKVFSFYSFSGIGFTFSADFYFSFICSASYVLYFLCTLLCKKLCKPKYYYYFYLFTLIEVSIEDILPGRFKSIVFVIIHL